MIHNAVIQACRISKRERLATIWHQQSEWYIIWSVNIGTHFHTLGKTKQRIHCPSSFFLKNYPQGSCCKWKLNVLSWNSMSFTICFSYWVHGSPLKFHQFLKKQSWPPSKYPTVRTNHRPFNKRCNNISVCKKKLYYYCLNQANIWGWHFFKYVLARP